MDKTEQNNVFIVSGGGRGITAKCVLKLAQYLPCKFILLGRSQLGNDPEWAKNITNKLEFKKQAFAVLKHQQEKPKPQKIDQLINSIFASREIKQTLQNIRDLGAEAEYLSVDITDVHLPQKIAPIVEKFGQITGIIHGAGVLADKLIENKSGEDFARIYGTKVDGLYNLLNCVNSHQVKHLILFSSAAGFYGNIGQADYALANEILNKFAHQFKHQYPDCQVISFNWGPWESGMVTPELKAVFAQRGVEVIPIELGTKIFVNQIIKANNDQVQILVGSGLIHPSVKFKSELKTDRIRRKLTLEANPFLQDHIIGNHAVLPMVFAIAWLANSAEEIYLGYKVFHCEDFKVLKGIIFDQTLANEYILELKEVHKIAHHEINLSARIWSKNKDGKVRYHYQGNLKLLTEIPTTPIYQKFNHQQDNELINLSPYRDGTLFHGHGFQGVKRILNITPEKLTMECILPEVNDTYWGQFPPHAFNPLAIDIQLQCALIWVRYFHDSACLPLRCQKGEHFRDIPAGKTFYVSMEVQCHTATKLVANITSHDFEGQVYAQVLGEVTISKQLNHLFISAPDQEINKLITFWRHFIGVKHPVGESLYSELYRHFVGEIVWEDRQDFRALAQKPRLYLANHQVGIESILFLFAISGLSNNLTHTLAKIEHQHSWMSELFNQIYAYPQAKDPELIFYFDRHNPLSMLKLLTALKKVIGQQQHSLLVHTQGTRSLSCRQPVTNLSAVFLDLVLELNLPIIPVKFVGGLPVETLEQRLEFPYRYTSQNYHLGQAIYPEDLKKLGNVERKTLILEKLNQLGGSLAHSFPHQPNLEFETQVHSWMQNTGVSEVRAVMYTLLKQIPNPTPEVQSLLKIIAQKEIELSDSPKDHWLREFAQWLKRSNSELPRTEVRSGKRRK